MNDTGNESEYFAGFQAGQRAATEAASVAQQQYEQEQYVPTPEYQGGGRTTVNIGGIEYDAGSVLAAQASMQVAQRLDAMRAQQAAAVAGEAAAEALAALEAKHGASFERDKPRLLRFLERHPELVPDRGDSQLLAESVDHALELMRSQESKRDAAAKSADDQAFADELVAAHQQSYASRRGAF